MSLNKKLIYLLSTMLIFTACNNNIDISKKEDTNIKIEQEKVNDKFFFLNSILTLNILDEDIDKDAIFSKVQSRVTELENKMSLNFADSEINKINDNAGIKEVEVSKDTINVIKRALEFGDLSQGKFDITVGNLVQLWGIDTDHEKVPNDKELETAVKTIDYKKIELDEKNNTVYLKEKGMKIDLGAIAKGYVADEINKILEENKVKSAISNLGGNIYVYGSKNGKDFKVGIRNPASLDPNEHLGVCNTQDNSIVTSGVYERFFEKDGVRYHHILSTSDGYPINNELVSTSIITKSSMDADALSTTTFALGLEKGLKLIESMDGVEAIFVTNDEKVYITSGLNDKFELTNKEYKLFRK